MASAVNTQVFPPGYVWAPGTVALKERGATKLNLFPVPTTHPDDPLNWSSWRKFVNYGLVCSYVLWTFVQLDIGYTAWVPMQDELGFSPWFQNTCAALNYAALAVGCFFFIPFVHKYGRRPLYIFSNAVQLAGCIWMALTFTQGDFIGANIISGLGGAICETVVQITIVDIFFVDQHATMNAYYLLLTSIGAFLGPVASGYIADSEGWRWMWWWTTIFVGIQFVLTVLFYEESKFVPVSQAVLTTTRTPSTSSSNDKGGNTVIGNEVLEQAPVQQNVTERWVDPSITPKTYWQRMAWITPTDTPVFRHLYQPVIILFTFPAVTLCAITFGCVLAVFAIINTIVAIYMVLPPYNFSPSGIGLMNVPPAIGTIIGVFFAGWLNDKSIVWFAGRNQGIYEPEMRLWMAIPSSLFVPVGVLVFGIGLAYSAPWIVLAVGCGIFGVGFIVCTDIALSYCVDCYQVIVGDALVGVVLTRNVVSVAVLFVLQYWIDGMGLRNLHITLALVMLLILLIPVIFLIYGKRMRLWTASRYEQMAKRQPTQRTF